MIDPFDTYTKYIAIKLTYDLSNSYDYFLYGGKTRQKKETFLKRKDRFHFYALAKKLNNDLSEIEAYLFVNMLYSPDAWVGNLLDQECYDRYASFQKYANSFSYTFKEEIKKLKDYMDSQDVTFNEMLSTKDGVPKLMEWTYAEIFTPMLIHGFHRVFGLLDKWEKNQEVFEPLLVDPLKRMKIFQNFAYRYSHRLTKKDIGCILKETFVEGE